MNEMETLTVELISKSGSARSYAFEALDCVKRYDVEKAKEKIGISRKEILKAHDIQTKLLHKEAQGDKIEINMLLIHAQDHLMTSILAKDLINEMIFMQEEINKLKRD